MGYDYIKIEDNAVGVIEQRLQSSLSPIHPDPEFVHRLRRRLFIPPEVMVKSRRGPVWLLIFLSAGLFVSTLLMLLFLPRKRAS